MSRKSYEECKPQLNSQVCFVEFVTFFILQNQLIKTPLINKHASLFLKLPFLPLGYYD